MVPLPPIFAHPVVKRARAFLASLLPAERAHFLFLVGALLIFCAGPYAFSIPFGTVNEVNRHATAQATFGGFWIIFVLVPIFSFFLAGLGAFAVCFRAAKRIVRRVLLFVVVPSVPGILAMMVERYMQQPRGPHSVFEGPIERSTGFFASLSETIRYPSFGMFMWLAGMILLGIGVWRVATSRNTLPVRFAAYPAPGIESPATEPESGGLFRFFFAVLVLSTALQFALSPLAQLVPRMSVENWLKWGPLFSASFAFLPSLVPLFCAMWFLRISRNSVLPGSLRRFGALEGAVAVLVPAVLAFLPSLLIWGFQHARWQINHMAEYPALMTFSTDRVSLWALALFLPAFAEELGWRCAIQPALTKRFGVRRGLLLVGLVWGLWHLPAGAEYFRNTAFAPLSPFAKLLYTTLLGACLGWLYLRTNSVWPSTILHGLYNILNSWVFLLLRYDFLEEPAGLLRWFFLALAAFLLFYIWPPVRETRAETEMKSAAPSRWSRIHWPIPEDDSQK